MKIYTLDLNFSMHNVIASYLIDTGGEPILIETGPDSVFHELVTNLRRYNLAPEDIKMVFLTHIHLDHAGSAWRLAQEGATIYVHPSGARHLVDPSRLLASARMIYKEEMDKLWGRVEPVPQDKVIPAENNMSFKVGGVEVRVFETEGHASHHNIFMIEDALFTGDTGGIKIKDGPVIPPTPPPDINIERWLESIRFMRGLKPDRLYPTHFGEHRDVEDYFNEIYGRLKDFSEWALKMVKSGRSDEEITKECDIMIRNILKARGASEELIRAYESADPFWMNAAGLIRYWRKKGVGGAG